MDSAFASGNHQPDHAIYSPAAHGHYIRWRALAPKLNELSFRSALDVGCAEGFFMHRVGSSFNCDVWGVDISVVAVAKMRKRFGLMGAAADGERLPFPDGSFDVVYSTEVVEHVSNPKQFVAEMKRVARQWVVITTPVSNLTRFRPDTELAHEGHINAFDREAIESLVGASAKYSSFRCNAPYAIIKLFGRHLGQRLSRPFIELDYWTSQHIGSATRRLWPLRNRDWLVVASGLGHSNGRPRYVCPRCRADLIPLKESVRCTHCDATYMERDGVLDFFA